MEDSSLKVVPFPHPTLRHKSKPIRRVDADLVRMVREMFTLMYSSNGIGLAANQVDLPLRLFIVNLSAKANEGEELVFINPVLSKPKGNEESEEGCLSFPELYGPVTRPKQITVQAYNLKGEEIRAGRTDLVPLQLGHLAAARQPREKREDPRAVGLVESVERGRVAVAEPADERQLNVPLHDRHNAQPAPV